MAIDPPYVMTPLEVAVGMPFEAYELSRSSEREAHRDPRDVLEETVRVALESAPCGVAFSGGRDSSLVLAIAVHVARREGLPEPVPLTKIFPSVEGTDEREWQELVVRHLRVKDWERVVVGDELDLIGPIAQRHLCEHGVVWSPAVHASVPLYPYVQGGTLLDGEGGDEVLGVERHRVAPISRLARSRGRRHRRAALRALRPQRTRVAAEHRRLRAHAMPWLRSEVRDLAIRHLVEAGEGRPLRFAESVRLEPRRRTRELVARSRSWVSTSFGVEVRSPLLDTEFVSALADGHRWLGPGGRTEVVRELAGDLLPAAIITRSTKAEFSAVYWGHRARAFVRSWDGGGLDAELFDVDVLRDVWSSGRPHAMTSAALQQAWLATSPHVASQA